jgi:hypothetical protein
MGSAKTIARNMSHVWKIGFSNFFTSPSRPTESTPYRICNNCKNKRCQWESLVAFVCIAVHPKRTLPVL